MRRLAVVGIAVALGLAACGSEGGSASSPAATAARFKSLIGAGQLLMRQGNAAGAGQLFEQAVAVEPKSAVARYDVGVADQAEGKTTQALDAYRQAIARDPRFVPALYDEGTILAATKPYRAMDVYRKVILLQPDSPTALLNLGLLELNSKGFQVLAIADLRHAIKLEPSLEPSLPPSVAATVESPPKRKVPAP